MTFRKVSQGSSPPPAPLAESILANPKLKVPGHMRAPLRFVSREGLHVEVVLRDA